MNILKGIGLVVAFALLMVLGVVLGRGAAQAAPPPQGFSQDCVVQEGYGDCTIYRFRDGPRVCYWGRSGHGVHTSLAISCVESP